LKNHQQKQTQGLRPIELLKFNEEFKEFNSVDDSQTRFKEKLDRGIGIKPVNICFLRTTTEEIFWPLMPGDTEQWRT